MINIHNSDIIGFIPENAIINYYRYPKTASELPLENDHGDVEINLSHLDFDIKEGQFCRLGKKESPILVTSIQYNSRAERLLFNEYTALIKYNPFVKVKDEPTRT